MSTLNFADAPHLSTVRKFKRFHPVQGRVRRITMQMALGNGGLLGYQVSRHQQVGGRNIFCLDPDGASRASCPACSFYVTRDVVNIFRVLEWNADIRGRLWANKTWEQKYWFLWDSSHNHITRANFLQLRQFRAPGAVCVDLFVSSPPGVHPKSFELSLCPEQVAGALNGRARTRLLNALQSDIPTDVMNSLGEHWTSAHMETWLEGRTTPPALHGGTTEESGRDAVGEQNGRRTTYE